MSKNRDALGDRMKGYEDAYRFKLPRRLPVIIRIDGKAFHTFTKGFKRPFDTVLGLSMVETAKDLCAGIEGIKLAYVQSDEISLLLTNNDTDKTEPWFNNNIQKLTSVAASLTTRAFHKHFGQHIFNITHCWSYDDEEDYQWIEKEYGFTKEEMRTKEFSYYWDKVQTAYCTGALFDARAFVLPENEVINYFIWRQQDAIRNSIQSVGHAYFSHSEIQGLNTVDIINKLIEDKNIHWNEFKTMWQRGVCITKQKMEVQVNTNCWTDEKSPKFETVIRSKWMPDYEIPIFAENRSYIEEKLIHV